MNIDPGRGRAGLTFTLVISGFQPLEVVTAVVETSGGAPVDNFTVLMDGDGRSNYLWKSPSDLGAWFLQGQTRWVRWHAREPVEQS